MINPTTLPDGAELVPLAGVWEHKMQVRRGDEWGSPFNAPLADVLVVARHKPEPTWQERLLAEYPDAVNKWRVTESEGYEYLVLSQFTPDGGAAWVRRRLDEGDPWHWVRTTIRVWRLPGGEEVQRPEALVAIPLSVAKRGLYSIHDDPNRAPGDEAIVRAAIAEAEGRTDG